MSRYLKGFFPMLFPKVGIFSIAQHRPGETRAVIRRERQTVSPFNEIACCEVVGYDQGTPDAEDLLHAAQFARHHPYIGGIVAGAKVAYGSTGGSLRLSGRRPNGPRVRIHGPCFEG